MMIRRLVSGAMAAATTTVTTMTTTTNNVDGTTDDGIIAHAAVVRGAAELDLEFYLRDLVGGNPKQGTTVATTSPAQFKATSTTTTTALDTEFVLWFEMTALDLLVDQVRRQQQQHNNNKPQAQQQEKKNKKEENVVVVTTSFWTKEMIQTQYNNYRTNPTIQRAFGAVVIDMEKDDNNDNNNDNQQISSSRNSFEMSSYAIWRTAIDSLPNDYRARDEYLRRLGWAILQYAKTQNVFAVMTTTKNLMDLNQATIALLEWFKTTIHLCSDYRIVNDNGSVTTTDQVLATTFTNKNIPKEKKWKKNTSKGNDTQQQQQQNKDGPFLFDELDDEALNVLGVSVNPLVTIVESATLGASLQLNGEGSRFVPDWLGPTLAALWEGGDELWCKTTTPSNDHDHDDPNGNRQRQQSRRQVSWEAFFVDPVYRPNPKDYFPTEQLYQFTIVNKE